MCSQVTDTSAAALRRMMVTRHEREGNPEMNGPGVNDQRDLEGLSALVTGATSGIGRAAAEELGRHGAEIVVHGRDADRGCAVADAITAAGGKARFVAADLTDPAQVDHLAAQAGPGRGARGKPGG